MGKISQDVAQGQVDIFLEYYEFESEDIPEQQQSAINAALKKIRRAVMNGRLEISLDNDSIKIVQTLAKPPGDIPEIEYKELHGRAKTAMKNNSTEYEKIYALTGSLTGLGPTAITKLKGKDLSTVECLGMIFLSV